MKTFLIELDNRPDGETNSSCKGYSSTPVALAEYYKRCGVAVTTTDFTSVVLEVVRADGVIVERKVVETQYIPPEEPEEGDAE